MSHRFVHVHALCLAVAAWLALASPVTAGDLDPTLPGRVLYQTHCAECHGDSGHGDGPTARKLHLHPRDFARGSFKCRCTESGALPSDDDLARSITRGLPGTAMLAHGDILSPADVATVISTIKTFSPRFAASPPPPCLPLPEPPPATVASVTAGKHIYRLLQCGRCHGKSGVGDGPAAAGLRDDWGERSKPTRLVSGGKLKCGTRPEDLYRTLHTGLNGSPMPSYGEAFLFAREAVTDIGADAEAGELATWLAGEPDRAALAALDAPARERLGNARAWALVHYLGTLRE